MSRNFTLCALAACVAVAFADRGQAAVHSQIAYPGSVATTIHGIDGGAMVGIYNFEDDARHGFIYEDGEWTTMDVPGADYTIVTARSEGRLVGNFAIDQFTGPFHGFVWEDGEFTELSYPGSISTSIDDMEGDVIVGHFQDSAYAQHGFMYDGANWTVLDFPGAYATRVTGISGGKIVGTFQEANYWNHGFIFDGADWTVFDHPDAWQTFVDGVDGDRIVGGYYGSVPSDDAAFYFDGEEFQDISDPTFYVTRVNDIEGDQIVGGKTDTPWGEQGAIITIPEPATYLLTLIGAACGVFAVRRGGAPR